MAWYDSRPGPIGGLFGRMGPLGVIRARAEGGRWGRWESAWWA